ncbi:MAG: D-alanyl-D-alanine carboxypeptidase/D-alanyl-D-alanine-endopeptidase [Rhodobacteraceae bacterium]|nr:D-alanyl-D-alanine carboxypeptidase/D-alanyl-D-alanine-endopeptidase [Paracoccaceae bacterium]
MLTRRFFLAAMLASAAMPALASAPLTSPRPHHRPLRGAQKVKAASPRVTTADIVKGAGLSGEVSILVADSQGRVLESYTPDKELPPASVTKSVTALYALQHLGSNHRFATSLIATGPVAGGIVQGDVILAGGGDPHLDTDGLAGLANKLRAAGITGVTGRFLVYSGALPYQQSIDPQQPDHVGYNPAISGLNLNFNRVYFEWKRQGSGYATSMDARTNKYRPAVRGIRMGIVNRQGPLFTYKKSTKNEEWTVMRGALGNGGGRWLPVREIDAYVGEVFRGLAAQKGVRLPEATSTSRLENGTVVAQEVSAPLQAQVKGMLKYSTNLTAEVTGLATTRKRGSAVRNLAGSAREMTNWVEKAYGVKGVKFVDHSGLGDDSRVNAGQMVQILARSGWNGPLRPLLKEIKLVNSKGRAAPIEGVKVLAKTGTLNFASALAGYIDTPNGQKLTFAIFTADMARRAKISRAQRERPEGGRAWRRRSQIMQQKLLRHWALEYGVGS